MAWSWTLNYGYGDAPDNDIIYGLDPGPPFLAYDMTSEVSGDSIPNITGTPIEFPDAFMTRGGGDITPSIPPVPPSTVGTPGVNQPTWETLAPSDVVGLTRTRSTGAS